MNKKDLLKKIVGFSQFELNQWVKSRLKGNNEHFHIKKGEQEKRYELIVEAYKGIKDEDFKKCKSPCLFHELLNELQKFSKESIEENKEYIHEMLMFFYAIPDFQRYMSKLYKVASSGNYKGIVAHDVDLHLLILKILAKNHTVGDYNFWLDQMGDNKLYTRTAFNAVVKRGYRIDIIMEIKRFGLFLNSFIDADAKEIMELKACFDEILRNYSAVKVFEQYNAIFCRLTNEQKDIIGRMLGIEKDQVLAWFYDNV